jgi:hypothetical protein
MSWLLRCDEPGTENLYSTRTKFDLHAKCAVCGFGRNEGIHLPALTGPRKGLPWGHEFVQSQTETETANPGTAK